MTEGETVKITGWQPQRAPPKNECEAMVQIVNEAVMSLFHESKLPLRMFACELQEIYIRCQQKVRQLRADDAWNFPFRGKRTWDRRVNDAASERYGAKIVAVTAGMYRPHPKMFQET